MKGTKIAVLVLMAVFVFAAIALAAPTGVAGGVTNEGSSTRSTAGAYSTEAIAGNVTELTIDAITVTNFWQGYYGNVTGTIVLANSNNDTLYDWSITDATGEVYASRASSITWGSIACASGGQVTAEDTAIGSTGKTDAVNETYLTTTAHNAFFVGSVPITADACPAVSTHNSTGVAQANLFSNALLHDGTNSVYASIMNNDATGFDNATHDFQLIIPENGTNDNTATTTYYFWVELA